MDILIDEGIIQEAADKIMIYGDSSDRILLAILQELRKMNDS